MLFFVKYVAIITTFYFNLFSYMTPVICNRPTSLY